MSWLENLKAGDKIIVTSRYYQTITTVEKITPTGRIKIDGEYFGKDGYAIGRGDTWYGRSHLKEATPEAVEKIRQNNIIDKAIEATRNIRKEKLTYEQASKILAALGQTEE